MSGYIHDLHGTGLIVKLEDRCKVSRGPKDTSLSGSHWCIRQYPTHVSVCTMVRTYRSYVLSNARRGEEAERTAGAHKHG